MIRAIKTGSVAVLLAMGIEDCMAQNINLYKDFEYSREDTITWSMSPVTDVQWSVGNVKAVHDISMDLGYNGRMCIVESRVLGGPFYPNATGYLVYHNETDAPGGSGPWHTLTHLGQFGMISDIRSNGNGLLEIEFYFHEKIDGRTLMTIDCSHFKELNGMSFTPSTFHTEFSIHSVD